MGPCVNERARVTYRLTTTAFGCNGVVCIDLHFEEVTPCSPKVMGKCYIFPFAQLWYIIALSALKCVHEQNFVNRGVINDVGSNFATLGSSGTKKTGEGKISNGRKALYVEKRFLECDCV